MKATLRTLAFISLAILAIMSVMTSSCGSRINAEIPDRNPATGEYDGYVVLYGDPHVHTVLSDGDETPDFALRYARDVSNLDWCCLTDHAEMMSNDGWVALDYYRSLPAKYDEPGEFSVLFGYEWTSHTYNHRNVYTTDNTIPIVSSKDPAYDETSELWALYSGYDVLIFPHHPMLATPENWWEFSDSIHEASVEFYSKWGLSLYDGNDRPLVEQTPGNGVFTVIAEEERHYGLIAGTDTHMTRPGSHLGESRQTPALEYSRPGITGVWATGNTREAIFEALKARRTYGLTGTRVSLEFTVNGALMGSEIASDAAPVIEFDVSSDAPIDHITLLKIHNQVIEEIETIAVHALTYEGSYTDDLFTDDAGYMLEVDLENTDMALCSPVWVEFSHSGGSVL